MDNERRDYEIYVCFPDGTQYLNGMEVGLDDLRKR